MKSKMLLLILLAVLAIACRGPLADIPPPVDYSTDPRLDMIADAAGAVWIAYPSTASRNINTDAAVRAKCDQDGWGYIFYEDEAVIGYEPFPENISLMHDAIRVTVELHNRDNPDKPWDFINVGMPVWIPDTSHDPVLAPLVVAFCDDTGAIRWQYTAEDNADYDRVLGVLALQLELWNRDNDPDCHVVLGGRV